MSLKNKLNRLKPHLSAGEQSENTITILNRETIEIPFLESGKRKCFPVFL